MTSSPITIYDKAGVERLTGSQRPAGGGSQPVMASYNGMNVTVTDGAAGRLTFDALGGGTELFDRTDPANPVFLADGLYLILATASPTDPLATPSSACLYTDAGGFGAFAETGVFGGSAFFAASALGIAQATAGSATGVSVANNDGNSHDFSLGNCVVLKLA